MKSMFAVFILMLTCISSVVHGQFVMPANACPCNDPAVNIHRAPDPSTIMVGERCLVDPGPCFALYLQTTYPSAKDIGCSVLHYDDIFCAPNNLAGYNMAINGFSDSYRSDVCNCYSAYGDPTSPIANPTTYAKCTSDAFNYWQGRCVDELSDFDHSFAKCCHDDEFPANP